MFNTLGTPYSNNDKMRKCNRSIILCTQNIRKWLEQSNAAYFLDVNLYKSQGKAINKFDRQLPALQSDLAKEVIKDPYNFDFLTLTEGYREKELEDALTNNITKF